MKDRVEASLFRDGVGESPWMTKNFDKGRFLNLDKLKSRVGVLPLKVRVGVSLWMTNHFDKGRFFNLNKFEKQGWSIPLEGWGWSFPKSDTSDTL